MSIRNARSIGAEELADRRRQAVALFEAGGKRKDIAPIVGAHRNVVGRWIRSWQERGEASFEVKPFPREAWCCMPPCAERHHVEARSPAIATAVHRTVSALMTGNAASCGAIAPLAMLLAWQPTGASS